LGVVEGSATHYGASYEGQPLGCAGHGVYRGADFSIVAVGYGDGRRWPCGTELVICSAGCIRAVRQDTCPGCGTGHVDLSEAGFEAVCGALRVGRCPVLIYGP
jgi:hypothetical protein